MRYLLPALLLLTGCTTLANFLGTTPENVAQGTGDILDTISAYLPFPWNWAASIGGTLVLGAGGVSARNSEAGKLLGPLRRMKTNGDEEEGARDKGV